MSQDFLGDRRRSLEDSFFAKENEKALEKLRAEQASKEAKAGLTEASGIDDDEVLEALVELGFTAETLAALSLYPLVEIAWADHKVERTERRAVLTAAAEAGIEHGHACYELLEGWLDRRPGGDLMTAWSELIRALKDAMNETAFTVLKEQVLGRALDVAKAAGGVLGIGPKVSDGEQAVLDQLERAFSD